MKNVAPLGRQDTSLGQGAQAAEQVGDGAPAQGQDGGEGEHDEAVIGRSGESRLQGVEDGADLLGQLVVDPIESATSRTGLLGLLASEGPELFPELLLGQARAGPVS